jgi:4-aminobutyrate aminotransferase-like enzyme
VCIGKALSGSLPLSAVLGSAKTMDLPDAGSMSSTHSANPMSCAAALANIGQIKRKNLIKEAARKGKILHAYLDKLKDKYPQYISYVLGKGLLAAIIITHPKSHKAACVLASRICEKAMQKGLLLMHTGRESIKIGPPLTISDEALKEGLGVLEESISELTKYE